MLRKMAHGSKDSKKARAGRIGGKKSSGNFKNNPEGASIAGKKSAFNRSKVKLNKTRSKKHA